MIGLSPYLLTTVLALLFASSAFGEGKTTVFPSRPSDISSIPNGNVPSGGQTTNTLTIHYRPKLLSQRKPALRILPAQSDGAPAGRDSLQEPRPHSHRDRGAGYFPEFGGVPLDEKRVVSPNPLPKGWLFQVEKGSSWMVLTTQLPVKVLTSSPMALTTSMIDRCKSRGCGTLIRTLWPRRDDRLQRRGDGARGWARV